jgi:homoserine kinase
MDQVRVLSPATVANVVCGFDCLGFALEGPADNMLLSKTSAQDITIIHRDNFGLSTDPTRNVAGVALQAFMDAAGVDHGFELEITKQIMPGSGIGSSSASACGAVVAANLLTGEPFSAHELIELAMAGEAVASGARHADNLAPCILGGFTVVRSAEPLDVIRIESPELYAIVVHPQIEVRTADARTILPQEVPLRSAIKNWSNLAALIAGLYRGDMDLISRCLVDEIVEPARQHLIPLFREVRSAAMSAGSLGGGISGSGPSIFMLANSREAAERVEQAMRDIYSGTDIIFKSYVSRIARDGVRQAE